MWHSILNKAVQERHHSHITAFVLLTDVYYQASPKLASLNTLLLYQMINPSHHIFPSRITFGPPASLCDLSSLGRVYFESASRASLLGLGCLQAPAGSCRKRFYWYHGNYQLLRAPVESNSCAFSALEQGLPTSCSSKTCISIGLLYLLARTPWLTTMMPCSRDSPA